MKPDLATLILSAVIFENLVFTRLYGVEPVEKKEFVHKGVFLGLALLVVSPVSAFLGKLIYFELLVPNDAEGLQTFIYVAISSFLGYVLLELTKKLFPKIFFIYEKFAPFILVNCSVLGVLLANATYFSNDMNGVALSVISAVFASLGFLLAYFIIGSVKRIIRLADPPKAFQGMPIYLISLGIIALIFSGLSGFEI